MHIVYSYILKQLSEFKYTYILLNMYLWQIAVGI